MAWIDPSLIRLQEPITDPFAAIRLAGRLLHDGRYVEDRYVEAMLTAYEQHGPYFVIAPGIAVPHARPEDGVIRAGVIMIQTPEGIRFGSETKDPVHLIFGLAADSDQGHLALLQKLSQLLGDQQNIDRLIEATAPEDISNLLRGDAQ